MRCVLLLSLVVGAFVPASADARPEFGEWLAGVRAEALERGIAEATLDAALADLEINERVIELDRKQPESSMTFDRYLGLVISDARVRDGRRRLEQHAPLLRRIARTYGVQPRFVVALWGIESDFGRRTGGFSVIRALSTLAWEGRRATLFRRELLEALSIVDAGHVAAGEMLGSWAGAMGQPQFMPSTFQRHAVDFDGDSRRDIWNTTADALASAANYLSKVGWKDDQTWGRRVRLPDGFDESLTGLETRKKMSEWRALGVRRAGGGDLPRRELDGSIVLPGGADGPAYLVYANYRALLDWNRSLYFATAVGLLSDRLN